MDNVASLIIAVMLTIAFGGTWHQSTEPLSLSHRQFHYRSSLQSEEPRSIHSLSYGEELLGSYRQVLGQSLLAIPLRLDFHHRTGATTADERRIVLCLFWPDIAELYPDFPFEKVCR